MGVTYQAQVEVFFAVSAYSSIGKGSWQAICRWELQKDYAFGHNFREFGVEGWPSDMDDIIGEDDFDPGTFDGKWYSDGQCFVLMDGKEWFPWALHLQKFVKGLGNGQLIRVMIWRE